MSDLPALRSTAAGDMSPPSRQLPPARPNMFIGFWRWWANLTGPRAISFSVNIFEQERLRRARLVSALLLLIVVVVLLLIPSTYPSSPSIWTPIAILTIGGIVIALTNRAGLTTLSPILFILLIDTALSGFFILKPTPTLNSTNMTTFDLFVLAVSVGGVILPKNFIPLTGILQIMLICIVFFLRPHDPSLVALIQFAGNPYVALAPTIVLMVVGTWLAWLHAWSVERALVRASQAEELAAARAELSQQALLTAQQKQRLEEGISAILEVHHQVAGGNLETRVPVHEDHELWQLGHALNTLLMRIQQQTHNYRLLYATYKEIEQIVRLLDKPTSGNLPRQPIPQPRTTLARHLLNALRK